MDLSHDFSRLHHSLKVGDIHSWNNAKRTVNNFQKHASAIWHGFDHQSVADVLRNGINEELARRSRLKQSQREANSWVDYRLAAAELGRLEGHEEWMRRDEPELYDSDCLGERLESIENALAQDDLSRMVLLIRNELTRDVGGIRNPELHHKAHIGTKHLIERYFKAVERVLERIIEACAYGDQILDRKHVLEQLEGTRQSYGQSALLLSGGGTLGMSHIGVIKALHEARLLPRVICGSSSGSIVASVVGNTTDEDLPRMLEEFSHGDLAVFVGIHEQQTWVARAENLRKRNSWFNSDGLRGVMIDLLGAKTTFLEAFHRTGRTLNITVSSGDRFQSRQLLNYKTAGSVVIWSAVVASCAVPFVFQPQQLLCKDPKSRNLTHWEPDTFYIDGSIEGDIPTMKLSELFNVNHTIVSQVNPHVVPFLADNPWSVWPQNRVGQAAKGFARAEAVHFIELLRELPFMELAMMKMDMVLDQDYTGDITIFPVDPIDHFWTVLRTPTVDFLQAICEKGRLATYPYLDQIKTNTDIELLIGNAISKVKEHISFSKSVSNLRRLLIEENARSIHASGGRPRPRKTKQSRKALSPTTHRTSKVHILQRPTNLVPGADLDSDDEPARKFQGESWSTSAESSSANFSLSSDDEYSSEEDIDAPPSPPRNQFSPAASQCEFEITQSMPNTPHTEKKGFFELSRSGSPAPIPTALAMTPITPRPSSPEATYRSQSARRVRSNTTVISVSPKALPYSGNRVRISVSPKRFGLRFPKVPRRRSYSTGMVGVPEPGRR